MRVLSLFLLSVAVLSAYADLQPLPAKGDANHAAVEETREQRDERMRWWREAKFGMFVHYGLYSGLGGAFQGREGGAEWIQKNLGLDTEVYAAEASRYFAPAPGCTEEWAALARETGCRYMVLTTKHHDGFALFDTKQSDFSAANLVGRDLVGEFAESCRASGLRVGFYHSVIDWHHPDYDDTICPDLCYPEGQREMLRKRGIPRNHEVYVGYLHAQVRELLSHYGPISVMWWDYSQGAAEGERAWKAPALISLCRELQPGVIMNNRLYAFSGFDAARDTVELDLRCGDFTTPEKRIPAEGYPGSDWEACMTIGDKWGFHRLDDRLKSPAVIIRQLQECAAKGGNLLLNISPQGDGHVPPAQVAVLKRIGAWMRVNSEAIYGALPLRGLNLPEGWFAARGARGEVYLYAPCWSDVLPGATAGSAAQAGGVCELLLPMSLLRDKSASVLGQAEVPVQVGACDEASVVKLVLPADVWQQAVEQLPVICLKPSPVPQRRAD